MVKQNPVSASAPAPRGRRAIQAEQTRIEIVDAARRQFAAHRVRRHERQGHRRRRWGVGADRVRQRRLQGGSRPPSERPDRRRGGRRRDREDDPRHVRPPRGGEDPGLDRTSDRRALRRHPPHVLRRRAAPSRTSCPSWTKADADTAPAPAASLNASPRSTRSDPGVSIDDAAVTIATRGRLSGGDAPDRRPRVHPRSGRRLDGRHHRPHRAAITARRLIGRGRRSHAVHGARRSLGA